MLDFPKHAPETASPEAAALLKKSQAAFGRVPGLHAIMAESPELLEGYQALHRLFLNTSFDDEEKTVVWQTINVEHECHYCVPAHTGIAYNMKVSPEIVNALRDETPLPSPRLEALRDFTLAMLRQRGNVTEDQLQAFTKAGYTQRHVLEIILGLAQKVMSNYTNHVAQTPVDPVFEKFAWQRKAK